MRWKASRFAYTIYVGPIEPKLFVLHRCDVRLCVNPAHLFMGTHRDNMLDAKAKGRLGKPICGTCGRHKTGDNAAVRRDRDHPDCLYCRKMSRRKTKKDRKKWSEWSSEVSAKAVERRNAVLEMRLKGKSYREIGAELGISLQTAWRLTKQGKT